MARGPPDTADAPYTERLARLVYWLIVGPLLMGLGLVGLFITLAIVSWIGETAVAVLGRAVIKWAMVVGLLTSPALLVLAAWMVRWVRGPTPIEPERPV